jgi:hypothetical protein
MTTPERKLDAPRFRIGEGWDFMPWSVGVRW